MWIRIIKSGLSQSAERLFYKTPGRRFRPQWFFSAFIIVILNYCKVDYKVFIIRNNNLINLSWMKSCLWWWSYYHYSLAQRPISHRIHMFLAALSIICKRGTLGIGCVSIWCASGRGFLFQASATWRIGALAWSSDNMYRYVRTHIDKRAHVLLITMALKQKQK